MTGEEAKKYGLIDKCYQLIAKKVKKKDGKR